MSPHFDADIAQFATDHQVDYMPGYATTTEIVTAMKAGCNIIKLFPGGQLGVDFIKDIYGPMPDAQLMPSGGVSLDNIKEWKEKGAVAVGIGSALSKEVDSQGFESVTGIAKKFVAAIH